MTLSEANQLIKERAKQSEIAANYVESVGGICFRKKFVDVEYSSLNRGAFHNGVGFYNGNGLSADRGFAIGGWERFNRLNGYLSELAAAAYVCQVCSRSIYIFHLFCVCELLYYLLCHQNTKFK
jgi:amino-acid N-acetyltransferase